MPHVTYLVIHVRLHRTMFVKQRNLRAWREDRAEAVRRVQLLRR